MSKEREREERKYEKLYIYKVSQTIDRLLYYIIYKKRVERKKRHTNEGETTFKLISILYVVFHLYMDFKYHRIWDTIRRDGS